MWEIRIQHDGLKAFRVIKGQTQADAQLKASLQIQIWDEKWARLKKVEATRWGKVAHQNTIFQSKETASALTAEATERIIALESILHVSLRSGQFLTWDSLKDGSIFSEPAIPPAPQQPFAKGKPLTLLNGSELLYLLEKYGHRSKIDLAAAKLDYRENHQN